LYKAVPEVSTCVEDVGQVIVDEALTSRPRDERMERGLLVRTEPLLERGLDGEN
jgi:hypothetical protein